MHVSEASYWQSTRTIYSTSIAGVRFHNQPKTTQSGLSVKVTKHSAVQESMFTHETCQ